MDTQFKALFEAREFTTALRVLPLLAVSVIVAASCTTESENIPKAKIAFIGDQGTDENAQAVLSLIVSEKVDLVLIQGDLGYAEGMADVWEENLSNAFGKNFPVLSVVGNHENFEWPLYQQHIKNRVSQENELTCAGNIGVKAHCSFRHVDIVQVAPGIHEVAGVEPEDEYPLFIESSFEQSQAPWRICSWHKNQTNMQTGRKPDDTGWDVYNACLNMGAIVATGHEHAYSRTFLMSDYESQIVSHTDNTMKLEPGRSFAFVNGLGGRDVRPQQHTGDWWASVYTRDQEAVFGALFCEFKGSQAECYFKGIDGSEPDHFSLRSAH